MNVASYVFQSPSTSQVQVGRLDPNSVKKEDVQSSPPNTNTLGQKAQNFIASEVKEVKPTVTANSIDIYA